MDQAGVCLGSANYLCEATYIRLRAGTCQHSTSCSLLAIVSHSRDKGRRMIVLFYSVFSDWLVLRGPQTRPQNSVCDTQLWRPTLLGNPIQKSKRDAPS
jgi:hypothetical protein